MSEEIKGKTQKEKGREEEAGGDLSGRGDFRREGVVDEEVGKARQKLSQAAEKGGEGLDNAADKAKEVLGPDDGN